MAIVFRVFKGQNRKIVFELLAKSVESTGGRVFRNIIFIYFTINFKNKILFIDCHSFFDDKKLYKVQNFI